MIIPASYALFKDDHLGNAYQTPQQYVTTIGRRYSFFFSSSPPQPFLIERQKLILASTNLGVDLFPDPWRPFWIF